MRSFLRNIVVFGCYFKMKRIINNPLTRRKQTVCLASNCTFITRSFHLFFVEMKEIASPAFCTSNVYVINSYVFACLHKMLLIPMYPILFLHLIAHIDSCVLLVFKCSVNAHPIVALG